MKIYLRGPAWQNHMSPLKGKCFLSLVAEVRESNHRKDLRCLTALMVDGKTEKPWEWLPPDSEQGNRDCSLAAAAGPWFCQQLDSPGVTFYTDPISNHLVKPTPWLWSHDILSREPRCTRVDLWLSEVWMNKFNFFQVVLSCFICSDLLHGSRKLIQS